MPMVVAPAVVHAIVAVVPASRLVAVGVGVTGSQVLAIGVGIELRATARVADNFLCRCGSCERCGGNERSTNQSELHDISIAFESLWDTENFVMLGMFRNFRPS
jgi:hypothetical protein